MPRKWSERFTISVLKGKFPDMIDVHMVTEELMTFIFKKKVFFLKCSYL